MKKENVANVILALVFALVAASIIGGTIHNIYVQQKVLNVIEKQETRRTDYSEAKHTLSLIHEVFTKNK